MAEVDKGGAPLGNRNAANAKLWNAAIHRALAEKSRVDGKAALDSLASELIKKCEAGDLSALIEFGNRIDGKSPQALNLGDPDGNPLELIGKVTLIKSNEPS